MSPALRRWLRCLGFLALGLWGFYLLVVNLYLNTSLAPWTINRKPEKFQIHWSWGWSLWPGITYLNSIETRGQSRKIQWYAHLDSVITTYKIVPLFGRVVDLHWVNAKGIDYRQRRRVQPGVDPGRDILMDPPIPGFTNPPDPDPQKIYPKKPRRAPWTILANRTQCDIKQIWIEGYRIAGEAQVDTSMSLEVRGPLAFPEVKFKFTSADLWIGDELAFEDLKMDLDLQVDPFVPKKNKGPKMMQFISGRIRIDSGSAGFQFLEQYFHQIPWLHFNGRGPLMMAWEIENGVLQPGSTFEIDRKEAEIHFLDRTLTGTGYVKGEVVVENGTPTSRLQVFMGEFRIAERGKPKHYITGDDFSIIARSTGLDFQSPFEDLEVTLDLAESEIHDLSFYNRYIPEKTPFSITSGVGRISYHFEGSHEERSLRGEIELDVDDLVAEFEGTPIVGDIKISAKLRDGQPLERRFDISGTRIDLKSSEFDWEGVISFPKSRMRLDSPMEIDAEINVEMRDTRPIVALFDAHHHVPHWVERLMTIEDINGSATLKVGEHAVEVTDMEITGKHLRALADLSLTDNTREGILYIRFRGFSLGIEMTKGKKDLKFIRPLRWFNERRAERLGAALAD